MSARIDKKEWGIVLGLGILSTYPIMLIAGKLLTRTGFIINLQPWDIAFALDGMLNQANYLFGNISDSLPAEFRNAILIILILFFLIAPILMVWSSHKRLSTLSWDSAGNMRRTTAIWYLSAILTVTLIPLNLASVFVRTYPPLIKKQDHMLQLQRERDEIRKHLMHLGSDVLAMYALDQDAVPTNLVELPYYTQVLSGDYVIVPGTDDSHVAKIIAVGSRYGSNASYKNANGETGRFELHLKLKPPATFVYEALNY